MRPQIIGLVNRRLNYIRVYELHENKSFMKTIVVVFVFFFVNNVTSIRRSAHTFLMCCGENLSNMSNNTTSSKLS